MAATYEIHIEIFGKTTSITEYPDTCSAISAYRSACYNHIDNKHASIYAYVVRPSIDYRLELAHFQGLDLAPGMTWEEIAENVPLGFAWEA